MTHAKNEDVITSLNEILAENKHHLEADIKSPKTTIHIIGAPRSGTTVLSQLILSYLDIGYVNHLTASFWKAPAYGIHLSRKLLGDDYTSNFESDFGFTNNILEPHEFSFFWKKNLNYDDFLQRTYDKNHRVDWANLKSDLYQMVDAYEKPIVLKSFLYGFHAQEAVETMPSTIFLYIKRDIYQNAYSILKLREKKNENISEWASIKPHQYSKLKNENPYRQIMGQIYFLNYEYEKQLNNVPPQNKLFLSYDDLCLSTNSALKAINSKIDNFTAAPKYSATPTPLNVREKKIPANILDEFKTAEDWLMDNFPELLPLKC